MDQTDQSIHRHTATRSQLLLFTRAPPSPGTASPLPLAYTCIYADHGQFVKPFLRFFSVADLSAAVRALEAYRALFHLPSVPSRLHLLFQGFQFLAGQLCELAIGELLQDLLVVRPCGVEEFVRPITAGQAE